MRGAALHTALESVLGEERVFQREEAASYAVDGLVPQAVAMPESVEQVAEVMALAHREQAAVIPWGGGTAMGLGNVPRRYDIALCLSRLNSVVEYEPADLTVTVQAGKTLADFQGHLAQNDQWLPLDPPSPEEVTVGGVLATNASGPSRHAYGTARDLVLGMRIVQADGRIIKAGGRVVKNVAGYDLSRLLIGSLGTLGVIVEATFKVVPLPKAEQTVAVTVPSAHEAYRFAAQTAPLSLRAVALLNAPAARLVEPLNEMPLPPFVLLLAVAGERAAVERSLSALSQLAEKETAASMVEMGASAGGRLWEGLGGLIHSFASGPNLVCKGAVRPSQVPLLIERIEAVGKASNVVPLVVSHLTAGIAYSVWRLPAGEETERGLSIVDALRRAASELGGTMVVEACPRPLKERFDVWGEPGADFPLMRRVKEQFDPQGILSPGRFLGRL